MSVTRSISSLKLTSKGLYPSYFCVTSPIC
ncbi:hypothetical protein [Pseudomonas sp. 22 E 5]|nr:hypothetical protein [Pseudomonas sp. 22 E 5]